MSVAAALAPAESGAVVPGAVLPGALSTHQGETVGLLVIVAILLGGALISYLITKIVWRIISIVVVVLLAVIVFSQRASIESHAKSCDATFFGTHLTPSNPTIRKHCQQVANS